MACVSADILQRGSITVVTVDADNLAPIAGSNAFDVDIALALAAAISARTIHFTIVLGVEIDDLRTRSAFVGKR